MNKPRPDLYEQSFFPDAQNGNSDTARKELWKGKKRGDWGGFVSMHEVGLGTSVMSIRYGIGSSAEGQAHRAYALPGPPLLNCTISLLRMAGRFEHHLMGESDCVKLKSSLTLFANIFPAGSYFERSLQKYYGESRDGSTLNLSADWNTERRAPHPESSTFLRLN